MSERALAQGEISREARRVLRKLMLPGAVLVLSPKDLGSALVVPGHQGAKKRLRVSAEFVEAFRRRDWIADQPDRTPCFALTDAGLGWILGELSTDDPFASQHRIEGCRAVTAPDGAKRKFIVNDGESPLGWLFRRKGRTGVH